VVAMSIGVMRLKPAAPSVERVPCDRCRKTRPDAFRQVRGTGSLLPVQEAVRQILPNRSDGGAHSRAAGHPGAS